MVVRIFSLKDWAKLAPGDVLKLPGGEQSRKIRVEVNCVGPARFDVVVDRADPVFLAVVEGYEVLEFTAAGDVTLWPTSEHEVWYFTNDGDQIATSRPEAVSFTNIVSRGQVVSPEQELIAAKMFMNMKRREAELLAEVEQLRAAAQPAHDLETGEIHDERENDPGAAGGTGGKTSGDDAGGGGGGDGGKAVAGQGAGTGDGS